MLMARRLPPLRAGLLLPAGLLAVRCSSTNGARERVTSEGDGTTSSNSDAGSTQSIANKLAAELERWLLPTDDAESIGSALRKLRDTVAEDAKFTADEQKRFPINVLMLKAMHDRERLDRMAATAKEGAENEISNRADDNLEELDREAVRKGAYFARFSAAAYGVMGNLGRMKELVAQEGAMPPADVLMDRHYLQKWFVSKHTSIAVDDVKQLVTTGSMETRAYFVAVDHSTRSVVLSIRGTFSISDTMVDLICNPVDYAGGKAHEGISKSALKVWVSVKDQVEGLLRDNNDYKLVLTGHSLGAGSAILLKILVDSDEEIVEAEIDEQSNKGRSKALDAGRPVHVECYAFGPPPVFSRKGAEEMRDVFSFVNGCDSIPTVSLGSMYSFFRTVRLVDKLPLNVYSRTRFILDSRVRLRDTDADLDHSDRQEHRDTLASKILNLGEVSAPSFRGSNMSDETENKDGVRDEDIAGHGDAVLDRENAGSLDEWTGGLVRLGGDIARFTRDVGNAAEQFYSGVGQVAGDVMNMSPEEVALTAVLVQQQAAGGGPEPDEMMSMMRECEEKGREPGKSSLGDDVTTGDLIVPGRVYHLHGDIAAGHFDEEEGEGNSEEGDDDESSEMGNCAVRRTSSEELSGIRLSSTMVADHSMDAYEPVMIALGQRYSKIE